MRLILAVVQPFKLGAVTRNLEAIPHFPGMTVGAVRGFGREHAEATATRGDSLEDFSEKVQIETVVDDSLVDVVVGAMVEGAYTGRDGDGIVVVLSVEQSVRIATRPHPGARP